MMVDLNNVVAVFLCLLSLASVTHATAYGWGRNDLGQLGLGHQSTVYSPVNIPFYSSIPLLDLLTATNYHIALATNGSAYGSGLQYFGQFAVGYRSEAPIKTPILCPELNTSLDISLTGTSCNANMNTGLLGWGNLAGYVQNKNTGAFPRVQVALASYRFDGKVLAVHSVMEGVIVRLANNTVWAAGTNGNGRLGTGNTVTTYAFVEVPFWRNVPLRQIFSSQSAHACGLAVNGSLYCWGNNIYGQLGVGDSAAHNTPTKVRFFEDNGYEIYKVMYGDTFTMVLTCGGQLFGFGANNFGQLGKIPDSRTHPIPEEVAIQNGNSNSPIVDVITGYSQTMARTEDNKWWVWGAGSSGALGTGRSKDEYTPIYNSAFNALNINRIKSSSQSFNFFGWNDESVTNDRLGCPVLENECLTGRHNCSDNAFCTDLERGYTCTCIVGWVGDGFVTGTGCVNENSCAVVGSQCVPESTCDDSDGVAKCVCPLGYEGDGRLDGRGCQDIDECSLGNPCAANAYCTNLSPKYKCTCDEGYRGDPDIGGCVIMCQAGQYATNLTNCDFCPPGTYTDVSGAPNCFPCPGGTYNSEWGSDELSDCKKCPIGGYSEPKASYCSLCVHGYTNDPAETNVDNTTCIPCPLGTYGYYGVCYDCSNGKFSFDVVAKQCRNCPPGFANAFKGSSLSCDACPAGTSSRGGSTVCAKCPAGYYSSAGSKDCLKCPLGTSTNGLTGQSSCFNCSAGYYSDKHGSPNCTACQAGTYTNGPAAATCERCPLGTFSTAAASTSCKSCGSAGYTPATGSTNCLTCESNAISVDGGTCAPCGAGQYLNAATRTCVPCAPGTAVAVTGQLNGCYACSPGSFASASGATYCKRCPVNTYTNNASGYTTCAPCPAGTSSPGGAYSCS